MYLGWEWKALSIEDNVSAITNIGIFMIKLGNSVIIKEPNYLLESYMGCWAPTKAHLVST